MPNVKWSRLWVVLLVAALIPLPALARNDHSGFYVIGELFFPMDLTTTLDLTSSDLDFGLVSLERELGLLADPDQERFRGGYRFGRRSAIELSYLSIRRSAQAQFVREFDVPQILPGLPATVDVEFDVLTRFDTEDIELSYKYFFVQNEAGELGLSVGVHSISSDFSLSGEASVAVPGIDPVSFGGVETDSITVPLPVVGLVGRARLTRLIYVNGSYKIFDASYDEYSGTYSDLQASVEIRLSKSVGLGAGLFRNELDVREDNADRMSRSLSIVGVDLERDGVFAFVRFGK